MNLKQREKILSINENTLIIGSDIAKHIHYARAQDFRGIEFGKPFKYENTRNGFESLWVWVKKLMIEYGKTNVVFGVEPTGHYWFPLAWFLHNKGVKVVLVNPLHVHRSKELDDNSPTKNDIKDARVIAQLIKDGRYSEPNMLTGVYAEIRVGMSQYQQLIKDTTRIKIRVKTWLDKYFPEFNQVFKEWDGKASTEVLKHCPLPQDIINLGVNNIIKCWKDADIRGVGIKRATLLMEQAKDSIGLTEGLVMARQEIKILLEQYEMILTQISNLLANINSLIKQISGTQEMLSIPSLGLVTIASFIGEVGNLDGYKDGQQIIKLAGLNLKEKSSGKHKGQTKITKRGRPRLRSILYRAVLALIRNNPEFKAIHKYLINRTENPLKKKQSIIALCGKLIRVLFTLGSKKINYNPTMFLGVVRLNQICQAA